MNKNKLFKSKNENYKSDTTRSGCKIQRQKETSKDFDDLDFDEMNDVWDEIDDI